MILAGCAGDDPLSDSAPQPAIPIAFSSSLEESRGVVTTPLNLEEFAVSATVYSPSGERRLYFAHEPYKVDALYKKIYSNAYGQTHYWLSEEDEYNFYAYTPNSHISFAEGVVDEFTYTVPAEAALQEDIVVASSIAAEYGQPVRLDFIHPLSRVSLTQGPAMPHGKIVSVTFSGIIATGTYNMLDETWHMNTGDTASFTWICDLPADDNAPLTGIAHNFFFIPQILGHSARLTVVFEDIYGIKEIHSIPLSGSWKPGRHYNYSLNIL